jgi:hypothetical protein
LPTVNHTTCGRCRAPSHRFARGGEYPYAAGSSIRDPQIPGPVGRYGGGRDLRY